MSAPELTEAEAAVVARFEAAPAAPESFDPIAAVRRVVELANVWTEMALDHNDQGANNTALVYAAHARHLRAALAPQADDGDRYDLATDLANRGLRACCGLPSAEHCP